MMWSTAERFSTQGISFVISIIIARIVAPDQYGLIAMVQVFVSLAQVFIDGGFGNALIQKQDRTETDYVTVFIFNLVFSSVLYLLMFFLAPAIARFYEQPELVKITRVISLNLIISSLSVVQKTRLNIDLDFKTLTKASLMAVIVSGAVGIYCAYAGFEVWALVVQSLLCQLLTTVALIILAKWHPSSRFSWSSFRNLFSFGSKLMVSNVLTSIYLNIYNLTIGKFYSAAHLAYYNRSFAITMLPAVNIESVLNRIIYPLECEVHDNIEDLKRVFYKYLHLSNVIMLPIMTLILVLAKPLVLVLLTEKWLPAVGFIQIYSLNFMFYAWLDQAGLPLIAVGKTGVCLKAQIIKRTVSLLVLVLTIRRGVAVICWGVALCSMFELLVNMFFTQKEVGIRVIDQFKSQADVIFVTAVMGLAVYLFLQLTSNIYIQLFVGCIIGALVYLGGAFLFKFEERSYIAPAMEEIKNKFTRK